MIFIVPIVIAILVYADNYGRLYVSDSGNNRIVVFDINGNYLFSFGKLGENEGEFFSPASGRDRVSRRLPDRFPAPAVHAAASR